MKIEDFKLNQHVTDIWGGVFEVVEILKTRVKLKILVKPNYFTDEEIITYDKSHLQFLRVYTL